MGVLRFRIYEASEHGNWQDVYRLELVKITDDTDAQRLAELCVKWSATMSDRRHQVRWIMEPWYDAGADLTAQDTHYLAPAPELPPATVTLAEAETAKLPDRPTPPALPAPLEPIRQVRRPHRQPPAPERSREELPKVYEYKVQHSSMNKLEKTLNEHATQGWRVVAITPDAGTLRAAPFLAAYVTFERPKQAQ